MQPEHDQHQITRQHCITDIEKSIQLGSSRHGDIEPASDQETATVPPPAGNGAANGSDGAAVVVDGGRPQQQHAGQVKAASGLWAQCAQMAKGAPGVHSLVWALNFVSFYFLYPSTFNILEVAAVDEPKLHMWETGIMRITRHPQMVGQLIWCLAHSLWIGNSFMLVTSGGLMAHHLFGCWHGDRRLSAKYGEAFEVVKARTSTFPLQAVWEGRQVLPADYYKEFLRTPYYAVTVFTLGAYFAHPIMQSASFYLGW